MTDMEPATSSASYLAQTNSRRGLAAGLTIVLHLTVFLLLVLLAVPDDEPAANDPNITTFDVERPGPQSPEPPREEQIETPPMPPEPVIVPVAKILLPTENKIPVSTIEQDVANASGGGCNLTGTVQEALRTDADIERLLPTIPTDRRSVANALALWKGSWVEPDRQMPEDALEAIQATVERVVQAAPDGCRMLMVRGPRFIYLPGADDTTVLAIGSGRWTWQEVADSAKKQEDNTLLDGRKEKGRMREADRKKGFEGLIDDIFGQ